MRQGSRRHRILMALTAGPLRLADLKRHARDPARDRAADRGATWSEICSMADEDLVAIEAGQVAVTDMGRAQLAAAEQVWAEAAS